MADANPSEEPEAPPCEQELVPWLVCERCGLPILSQAELIEEKFHCWNRVTWAYELAVLGREAVWCYSATNANDHRFDVVRVLPSAAGRSIICRGRPTAEYSWFPGFSWSMAHCRMCDRHLGWAFSPDTPQPAPGSVGHGHSGVKRRAERDEDAADADAAAAADDVDARGIAGATGVAGAAGASGAAGATDIGADRRPADGRGEAAEAQREQESSLEQGDVEMEEEDDMEEHHGEGDNEASGPAAAELAFLGLVLTDMREKDLSSEEVNRRLRTADVERSQDDFLQAALLLASRADVSPQRLRVRGTFADLAAFFRGAFQRRQALETSLGAAAAGEAVAATAVEAAAAAEAAAATSLEATPVGSDATRSEQASGSPSGPLEAAATATAASGEQAPDPEGGASSGGAAVSL